MELDFGWLSFKTEKDAFMAAANGKDCFPFAEAQIAGENKDSHLGIKKATRKQLASTRRRTI